MTASYELKIKEFGGPIEKLLELIEEKKLDVTTVSLSEITADFLLFTEKLAQNDVNKINPGYLADFMVVASKLILIKSKALLPQLELSAEEEGDIKDLEIRLKIYAEFKRAKKHLENLWNSENKSFGRELFGGYKPTVFYPPKSLTTEVLSEAMAGILRLMREATLREKRIAESAIISVETKMRELVKYFETRAVSNFSELAKDKAEIIAMFLAVLHLFKDRFIEIEQEKNFGDIVIKNPALKKRER